MKSKMNLTRFTYETAAFEGWRLCFAKRGHTFMKYFPDRAFGDARKSLVAGEKALAEVRDILEGARMIDGKLTLSVISKVEKLSAKAV